MSRVERKSEKQQINLKLPEEQVVQQC